MLQRTAFGEPVPGAGLLTPQGRIAYQGQTGPLDDVAGTGFVLACREDPRTALDVDGTYLADPPALISDLRRQLAAVSGPARS